MVIKMSTFLRWADVKKPQAPNSATETNAFLLFTLRPSPD